MNDFLVLKKSIYEEMKNTNRVTLEDKMVFLFDLLLYNYQEKNKFLVLVASTVLNELLEIQIRVDIFEST